MIMTVDGSAAYQFSALFRTSIQTPPRFLPLLWLMSQVYQRNPLRGSAYSSPGISCKSCAFWRGRPTSSPYFGENKKAGTQNRVPPLLPQGMKKTPTGVCPRLFSADGVVIFIKTAASVAMFAVARFNGPRKAALWLCGERRGSGVSAP